MTSTRVPTEAQCRRMRAWVEELEAHHKRKRHEHRVMENNPERDFAAHLAQWMVDLELGTEFDWTIYERGGSPVDHLVRGYKFDTKNVSFTGHPRNLIVAPKSVPHVKKVDYLILTHAPDPFVVGRSVELHGYVSVKVFLERAFEHDWGWGECLNMSEYDLTPFADLVAWSKGEEVKARPPKEARVGVPPLVKEGRLVLDFTEGPMKIRLEEM